MLLHLIYVQDEDYYRLLPPELGGTPSRDGRVKIMGFPPLGIQTLAPAIRQHGHQVRLFDMCHPAMKAEHIAEAVREEAPDVIGLSFLSTTTYPATRHLAHVLKTAAPATPIIVGGPFATINARQIIADCPDIDAVGVGEGEELIPDYLAHLEDPSQVAGLVWRKDGKTIANPPRPLLQNLERFPYPDRTSLPVDYIESLPLDVPAVLSLDKFCTMQTSRGCPYTCVYCDIPSLSEGRWRKRTTEHVLGELEDLEAQGYRSIYFTDDHFLVGRKRIEELCQGYLDRKLTFHWGCEGRVDAAAVDQFPLMRKANCTFLAYGIESGTQKVLDRLDKRQTLAQIDAAVKAAKQHGIDRVHGFFLVGSPDETEADIVQSFKFAAKLRLDTFGFNRLCVYRGTPLWQEYLDREILDDERDWDKWFKCSDIDPTVLPGEVINSARKRGYALLFLRRLLFRPIQTINLLRTLGRNMKLVDILRLLASPFRRRKLTLKPSLPARMVDEGLTEPVRSGPQLS